MYLSFLFTQVEQFKVNWLETDALHSRFDPFTGDLVTEDMSWGHLQVALSTNHIKQSSHIRSFLVLVLLQIDATSLFLLMIAQITVSGVKVCSLACLIYTHVIN